jgi:RsiW-degrading membrane proteinase PrsW (M82 family)
MEPGNLGSALVFGALPALVVLALVYWLDRYEKEPATLLAFALGVGAILAPSLAVLLQSAFDVPTSIAVQTAVPFSRLNATTPIIEEIVRGLAIFATLYLVRREVDTLLDGMVYGAVVGTGFGLAATFMAILTTPSLGGDVSPSMFAAMVASLNHTFYGAVIGVTIAAARRKEIGTWAAYAVVGIAIAAGFHLLHDYLPSWVASDSGNVSGGGVNAFLDDLPNFLGLVALAVLAVWGTGREGVLVEQELREEVASGAITQEEYDIVSNPMQRFASLTKALFGPESWALRRKLYALQVELAFRKAYRRTGRRAVSGMRSEDTYRAEIAETRAELVEIEGGAR